MLAQNKQNERKEGAQLFILNDDRICFSVLIWPIRYWIFPCRSGTSNGSWHAVKRRKWSITALLINVEMRGWCGQFVPLQDVTISNILSEMHNCRKVIQQCCAFFDKTHSWCCFYLGTMLDGNDRIVLTLCPIGLDHQPGNISSYGMWAHQCTESVRGWFMLEGGCPSGADKRF